MGALIYCLGIIFYHYCFRLSLSLFLPVFSFVPRLFVFPPKICHLHHRYRLIGVLLRQTPTSDLKAATSTICHLHPKQLTCFDHSGQSYLSRCQTLLPKRTMPQSKPNHHRSPRSWKRMMSSRISPLKVSSKYPSASLGFMELIMSFPDWPQEEAEQTTGSAANGGSEHLWEESWDDDDAAEDFSKQLQ